MKQTLEDGGIHFQGDKTNGKINAKSEFHRQRGILNLCRCVCAGQNIQSKLNLSQRVETFVTTVMAVGGVLPDRLILTASLLVHILDVNDNKPRLEKDVERLLTPVNLQEKAFLCAI